MNNNIYYSNDFVTNFKPNNLKNFNNLTFLKKNKTQIFCKNFFLFILLLKYRNNHSNKFNFKKCSFHIKPTKKKVYTILRSPYRHKLARQQFFLLRYFIKFSLKIIFSKNFIFNKYINIIDLFYKLKEFNDVFETNIIYNHKKKLSFNFFFNCNFILKNF